MAPANILEFISPLSVAIQVGLCVFVAVWASLPFVLGRPWLPTSLSAARKMFQMVGVKPGDLVVELGAGDG